MIRSYHTLACVLLGIVLTLLVQRGLDLYAVIALALAVPWDKLAKMAGDLAAQALSSRKERSAEEEGLEEAWR
jgi:hypothetical protein